MSYKCDICGEEKKEEKKGKPFRKLIVCKYLPQKKRPGAWSAEEEYHMCRSCWFSKKFLEKKRGSE